MMGTQEARGGAEVVDLAARRAERGTSHAAMWREVESFRRPLARGDGAAMARALARARALWERANAEDDEEHLSTLGACNALTDMLHAAPVGCLEGAATKAALIAWEMSNGFEPEPEWIERLSDGLRQLASASLSGRGGAP